MKRAPKRESNVLKPLSLAQLVAVAGGRDQAKEPAKLEFPS
jgi:hypothetical protein